MDLASSPLQIISAILVFFLGAFMAPVIGRRFHASGARSLAIYLWHTLFCMTYSWYAQTYGGDAIGYYQAAVQGGVEFDVGTAGVQYLTMLVVQVFGLSLLGTFLFYNIFGTIGLLAFDACLRMATEDKTRNTRRLATLIVFLPSVSFWSSGVGKDALSFMATGLALWAALELNRRTVLMALAVVVMLLVRPHIAGMMMLGLTVAVLVQRKVSPARKMLLGAVAAAVATAMVPFALQYAGVGESNDADALMSYVESRQASNMEGGSSVDIAAMSLPMKLFTYLFRPLIFEARSVFSLAAAIDNLILLYLFVMGGRILFRSRRAASMGSRTFLWTYSLMAWLILALTTANLGIAMRQKWMFAPMLILLFISVMGRARVRPVDVRQLPVGGVIPRSIPFARSPLRKP